MKKPVLLLTALGLGLSSPQGMAGSLPEGTATPLPYAKPDSPAAVFPMQIDGRTSSKSGRLDPAPVLKAGLDALSDNDAKRALIVRNGLAEGSVDRQALTWALAMSGLPGVPAREIAIAREELKDWPGLGDLAVRYERALFRENPDASTVLETFRFAAPRTPEGRYLLVRAQRDIGKQDDAAAGIRALWRSEGLDKALENRILKEFEGVLTVKDHKARMDYLMYRGRVAQATRFARLGEAQSLFKAWSARINGARNAEALMKAVDPSWKDDPAFLFLRVEALRRKDKYREAAALLAKAPRDPALLISTSEWWDEQRIVARGLADLGDYRAAYALVSAHTATLPADIADAEFHAGWYALRNLGDPSRAEKHFRRILDASSRPISASRAWYWLGRAADAANSPEAAEHYRKAASHPGTFYGQLAAARLQTAALRVELPAPTDTDRQTYSRRPAVAALDRFEAAGHQSRTAPLLRALAEELESPGELAMLVERAERRRDHNLALHIGKAAFSQGRDVAALAFPIGAIPAGADIAGSGKALAYSIARQESAFNPAAVSPANARGLLQLLPGTAKAVAKRHGLAYASERLTSDPGYNATLGAHYLGEQIESFGGSYILTFIAYNAGPRRVSEWIKRYGDPRGKPIEEVIDWIERIPFPETRNYVQRITENYQIYKARLGQETNIVADLRYGRTKPAPSPHATGLDIAEN
jgi:Soluble lytic murein transglycosylase and related regulatory proteins (some contain LysM/invasin domains)